MSHINTIQYNTIRSAELPSFLRCVYSGEFCDRKRQIHWRRRRRVFCMTPPECCCSTMLLKRHIRWLSTFLAGGAFLDRDLGPQLRDLMSQVRGRDWNGCLHQPGRIQQEETGRRSGRNNSGSKGGVNRNRSICNCIAIRYCNAAIYQYDDSYKMTWLRHSKRWKTLPIYESMYLTSDRN